MSSSLRPLAVGTLCLTLLRKDPANAGRVAVVLAREGAMDDLGYADGYFIEVVDGSRPVTTYICDGPGQPEIDTEPCLRVYTERRYLVPLSEPGALATAIRAGALPAFSLA